MSCLSQCLPNNKPALHVQARPAKMAMALAFILEPLHLRERQSRELLRGEVIFSGSLMKGS